MRFQSCPPLKNTLPQLLLFDIQRFSEHLLLLITQKFGINTHELRQQLHNFLLVGHPQKLPLLINIELAAHSLLLRNRVFLQSLFLIILKAGNLLIINMHFIHFQNFIEHKSEIADCILRAIIYYLEIFDFLVKNVMKLDAY